MKHNLCLVPIIPSEDAVLHLYTNKNSFITVAIDDDSSTVATACDLVQNLFSLEIDPALFESFKFCGTIEHDYQEFSIMAFFFPKNYELDDSKKEVKLDLIEKELEIKNGALFKRDDSFNLAVCFKLLSMF